MATVPRKSSEQLCNYFLRYLITQHGNNRHVTRVAAWLGFVASAIERAGGTDLRLNRRAQALFTYIGRTFKVRFDHKLGGRGGLVIVEVMPGAGMPDGQILAEVRNLAEAETLYLTLGEILRAFVTPPLVREPVHR